MSGFVIPSRDTYRGWAISFDFPPIPIRSMDWSATHPDYDASFEDGEWQATGGHVHGATLDEVKAEIDAWIEENEPAAQVPA
jgi:hypothetical protein